MDLMKIISNIVIGFIGTALTAAVMWMVSEVASMSDVKNEIKHVNKNMEKLNDTIKEGNKRLDTFNTYHTQNLSIITKAIAINSSEIRNLEKMCERNEQDIENCMATHINNTK